MPSKRNVQVPLFCNFCEKNYKTGPRCSVCLSVYHLSCAKKSKNVKIISDDVIICGEFSDNNASRDINGARKNENNGGENGLQK